MSDSATSLVLRLEPASPAVPRSGMALAIVSFNTAGRTIRCLESLAACAVAPDAVHVLDNGSDTADFERLHAACAVLPRSTLHLHRSDANLGFAAGSNAMIAAALADPACRAVILLNNDAVALPSLVGRLGALLDESPGPVGLAGGRMNRLDDPSRPDTLGISLYASLMPANRLDVGDPYLGPTGGCCALSRDLVERLLAVSGYCFDARYFCYCEDTDLALRAVLLGYRPAYTDEALALHEGQASSGADSEFIAYHGLRNLLWMHAKLVPGRLLAKYGLLLAAAHAMTIVRQGLVGRLGLMARVYRDAFARRAEFREERARFAAHAAIDARALDERIAPRFYRKGYLGEVLGLIGRRWRGDASPAGRAG